VGLVTRNKFKRSLENFSLRCGINSQRESIAE
jgi:hypothetical protein